MRLGGFLCSAALACISIGAASEALASPVVESPGVVTFQSSGIFDGQTYSSVTMNRNNYTSTMHFDNGSQYTVQLSEGAWWAMFERLAEDENYQRDVEAYD
jgi:hypothetical protein